MSVTTAGFEVRAKSRQLRDFVELISSMRFAISLLTVICIAAVIGTVVQQHQPFNNYVNQFGPFWAEVFNTAGLFTVYSAWWFLLILAFLVTSTSLCIARNAPKIIADLGNWKLHLREQALQAFHLKGQATLDEPVGTASERVTALLTGTGWKARSEVRRDGDELRGTMIAARRGATNKLGYIAAHSAIVLVCLGGLFDGDLVIKAQMLLQGKSVYGGSGLFRDIGPEHRLAANNPTFRADLLVPEGATARTAVINMQNGVVLQDLPFDVELKKFIVEYYDTGMPKLFASDIVIHDHDTGKTTAATVKVNEPVFHHGVAIYQSSFDDGGSAVKLRAVPLTAGLKPFDVDGTIGGSTLLQHGPAQTTLEFTGLRVINVENLSAGRTSATDVRKVDLASTFERHLGSGAKSKSDRELRNVGPSVSYKLRDAAGQAHEFNNYMVPVELDGQRVFLVGTRDDTSANMRYLRIPADDKDSMQGWARLRVALTDPGLREQAARRYAAMATPADNPAMRPQLAATALRALGLFAGAETPTQGAKPGGGLLALSDFLEDSVPAADRSRISEVLLRILNGSLFELLNITREQAGLAPRVADASTQAFMTQAVLSLSDSFFYPAPMVFELADFKQVQASVFQVARAPGKTLVYLGAVLLIVGVFTMLFVRERRLWVWIAPTGESSGDGTRKTKILTAMSTTRRTLDADAEFERLKAAILKEAR